MALTPEQWENVKELFEAALDRLELERPDFLRNSCHDAAVRHEVERLLAHHLADDGFLEPPLRPPDQPVIRMQLLAPGDTLAERFRISRFLASGGMGEVYEAEDTELHERVALKMIRPELLSDGRTLDRFRREVHLAKSVTHANVCRIFDLFRHQVAKASGGISGTDFVFVSMELLEGETLAQYLKREERMTTAEAYLIASQVASGLAAAHDAGVLHRDMKPGNIILVPGTKRTRAVITDFGLALRSSSDSSNSGAITDTEWALGTPAYMSPEQVEGHELTPASDVYSLGLVFYQMVTGSRPFDHASPLSMAVRRLRENPVSPRLLVTDLDPRWDTVILRCLEREPARRFQNANEVALALTQDPQIPSAHMGASEERFRVLTSEKLASVGPARNRLSESAVRLKTWELSRDHLSSILRVDEYDLNGQRIRKSEQGIRKSSYDEDLFVPPAQMEVLKAFVGLGEGPSTKSSQESGMVVLGSAGAGKSNLLASTFLHDRSAGSMAVFLSGRLIDIPDLAKFVSTQLSRFVSPDCDLTLLQEFVRGCQQRLTLYIDAANEYCGPDGAFGLLDSVRSIINQGDEDRPLKIIVSCRAETWRLYEEEKGIKLFDSNRLFGGQPLMLQGFGEYNRASLLYEKYSRFYGLLPATYTELSPAVKDLIRSPLMMSVVAETYSNQQVEAAASKVIPADLDYYNVFRRLTRRKKQDAGRLLNRNDPRREYFDEVIDEALLVFSSLLVAQLTSVPEKLDQASPEKRVAAGDALLSSTLSRNRQFIEHWNPPEGRDDAVSTFQAIVQVGLIDAIALSGYGSHDELQKRTAYKFFHDQYTQYWLSQIYQTETLGKLGDGSVSKGEQPLHQVAATIDDLIQQAVQAPVLAGAIDHWLYRNMVTTKLSPEDTGGVADITFLMPLLNHLALSSSPVVQMYVSSFLTNLTLRGILKPEPLFQSVFREGNERLRASLADYFLECWPGVSPDLLNTFLAHCDVDDDAEVLKRLGGVFAYHFERSPTAVMDYLDRSLKPVDTFPRAVAFALEQSQLRVGWRKEYSPEIAFLLTFGTLSTLANFHSAVHMSQMRSFVRRKYPKLLDMILNRPSRMKVQEEAFRLGLHRRLEREGVTQWDQVIGAQGNDAFFVEEDGIVQRDELYNYFKYLVAAHNGELEELDLSPDSDFRRTALAMLTFKPASGIGYIAAVSLAMRLVSDPVHLEKIVAELVSSERRAGVYFASLLLVDISYMDPTLSRQAVKLFVQNIVPKVLDGKYAFERAILDCLGIASSDLAVNWPICEPAIRHMLDHLDRVADDTQLGNLGSELAKVSYFDDINAGKHVIELFLKEDYLKDSRWRGCIMKVLAGMQMRNPAVLRSMLERHGEDNQTLQEVRTFSSDDLKDDCHKFFYMVSWNRLIAKAILNNATLRYLLIKILMGGLAQSNSVIEYTREFRRFVIEVVRAYWGEAEDPARYAKLTVQEALSETLASRRIGGGKLWVPRSIRTSNVAQAPDS